MTVSTATFDNVSAGMCPFVPQHEMGDSCGWFLQDVLLNQRGIARRRGPVSLVSGAVSSFAERQVGMFQTQDPQGNVRIGVLGSTTNLRVLDISGALLGTLTWPASLSTSPYTIVDAKPALGGGMWIGAYSNYGVGASQFLALWKGAYAADYSTGTVTVTQGSTSVTGSGTTFTAGMQGAHLFNNAGRYIGTVAKFNSTTSLTLEQGALAAIAGAAFSLKALRGWMHRVGSGTITVTAATTAVIGSNTKFVSEGMQAGTWDVYRASDNTLVGTVTGSTTNVPNNLGLTISSAAISMVNEPYYAIKQTEDVSIQQTPVTGTRTPANSVGAISAVHLGTQFYANLPLPAGVYGDYTTRVWQSTEVHPESVDLSPADGSFFTLPSTAGVTTAITGMLSSRGGLLIWNENETFLLTGSDATNFATHKIVDDGAPSGMSIVPYGGGAIWAGKNGIYYFDGSSVHNIVDDRLGDYWKQTVKSVDFTTARMYGFVWRDHYFLHVENGCTSPISIIKGSVSSTPARMTFGIYLPTRAVSTYSNMLFRGWVRPVNTNSGWFLVNDSGGLGRLCDGVAVLDTEGNDTVTCENGTVGPDFYIETKKYSLGDPDRLKVFRHLIFHYLVQGDVLKVDVTTGLNTTGQNVPTGWTISQETWDLLATQYATWDQLASGVANWDVLAGSTWQVRKVQYQKTSQLLSYRFYQSSSSVTAARLASWQIGFKARRPGAL